MHPIISANYSISSLLKTYPQTQILGLSKDLDSDQSPLGF